MSTISVENDTKGLLVKLKDVEDSEKTFTAEKLEKDTYLLYEYGTTPSVGTLDVGSFHAFLGSLADRKWTGSVSVSFGDVSKKIYLSAGRLVFASSNSIDDRLGEVIYRRGMISLDEMMDAAVMVTKDLKFGQACLEKGTFTNEDLWSSLRAQVFTIVKSLFLYPSVKFSMNIGDKPPTEVAFWESTSVLFAQTAAFGQMYRFFAGKLETATQIVLSNVWKERAQLKSGTFKSDFVELIEEKRTYGDILGASKLLNENTDVELLSLYQGGALSIVGGKKVKLSTDHEHLSPLKGVLDGYALMVGIITQLYQEEGKPLPTFVLTSVINKIDSDICPAICVRDDLYLTDASVNLIFAQCAPSLERTNQLIENIRGLLQYLVLSAVDSLPYEKAKIIKKEYASFF